MLISFFLFRLYTTGGRERAVDERLNIARIYVGRAPRRVSKKFQPARIYIRWFKNS